MNGDRSLFLKVKDEEKILRIFQWSEQKLLNKIKISWNNICFQFMLFLKLPCLIFGEVLSCSVHTQNKQ